MRIIHCADIHIDSKLQTHFSSDKASERRNEILDAFNSMVDYAKQNDVKAIIIAGDLFDTKTGQQKIIKSRVSYIIHQNPEIDFLYLRGNHDEDVDFALDEPLPNLKRFSKDKWGKYSYGNVSIYGREFSQSVHNSVYSELTVDANDVNIVVMHGTVVGYKSKKEVAAEISLSYLTNKNIDYIALGHIHEYKIEKLDSRCFWSYSGCLEGRGFDECGEKGFVLLDINGNKVESKFIPNSRRQIYDVHVNLNGLTSYASIMDLIKSNVENISSRDIVQVVLEGEIFEDTEIELEAFTHELEKRFYFIRFKNKTEPKIEYEKYENDISLKGEFIRLVKSQTDLSEEEKAQVIMLGIKALAGRLN